MGADRIDGQRRRLVGWTIAMLAVDAGAGVAVAAPAPDFGLWIDDAGRQRMFSQRIVKAYCQIGLDVAADAARQQLVASVDRFDKQLAKQAREAPSPEARRAAARLIKIWQPYKQNALGRVSREGARKLVERDASVLAGAQEIVIRLQEAAGTPHARLVNMAGRQRMLAQRMAKVYMLRAWKVHAHGLGEEMDASVAEFDGALATLRAAPENTPAITTELNAVALQWEWFKGALSLEGAESYPHIVAEASESILGSMELVTAKYAALARG